MPVRHLCRTNLLFVLSGAGRLNYGGTREWLSHTDPNTLESIEFALCLEDLTGDKLYLHVSRPPTKDPVVGAFIEVTSIIVFMLCVCCVYHSIKKKQILNAVSARMNVPVEVVHRKVSPSALERAFEHEQFSFKRIVAGTLSSSPLPTPQYSRSRFFVNKKLHTCTHCLSNVLLNLYHIDIFRVHGREAELLARNIKFVGEVIAAKSFKLTEEASEFVGMPSLLSIRLILSI